MAGGIAHHSYFAIVDIAQQVSILNAFLPDDSTLASPPPPTHSLPSHVELAFATATASIVVKEALFRWTYNVGVECGSSVRLGEGQPRVVVCGAVWLSMVASFLPRAIVLSMECTPHPLQSLLLGMQRSVHGVCGKRRYLFCRCRVTGGG